MFLGGSVELGRLSEGLLFRNYAESEIEKLPHRWPFPENRARANSARIPRAAPPENPKQEPTLKAKPAKRRVESSTRPEAERQQGERRSRGGCNPPRKPPDNESLPGGKGLKPSCIVHPRRKQPASARCLRQRPSDVLFHTRSSTRKAPLSGRSSERSVQFHAAVSAGRAGDASLLKEVSHGNSDVPCSLLHDRGVRPRFGSDLPPYERGIQERWCPGISKAGRAPGFLGLDRITRYPA